MRKWRLVGGALVSVAVIGVAAAAGAADFPEPKTSEYVIKDFIFHTGEVMPEMKVTPRESGMAPVDHIQMYYAIYGEGDPVLLIHGGLGNADEFGFQVPALAESHEVIVADGRGRGRSTSSASPTASP